MTQSHLGALRSLSLDQLGQNYRRYRLPDPEAEADMVGSLRRYGQLTPLVVCLREETSEILDGFNRLAAASDQPCLPGTLCRIRGRDRGIVMKSFLNLFWQLDEIHFRDSRIRS